MSKTIAAGGRESGSSFILPNSSLRGLSPFLCNAFRTTKERIDELASTAPDANDLRLLEFAVYLRRRQARHRGLARRATPSDRRAGHKHGHAPPLPLSRAARSGEHRHLR